MTTTPKGNTMRKTLTAAVIALTLSLAACTEEETISSEAYTDISNKAAGRSPYIPTNDVEYENYNKAQQLYDSPESIIWCTTSWGNPSAPLVTTPIVGKLTSSSTSYFPNSNQKFSSGGSFTWSEEARSVDGMFHGNPPGYRYGFTPGGQYVDFYGMEVFCTTALTEFQRQPTTVSVETDTATNDLQRQAEDLLKAGDTEGAAAILEGVNQ